MFVNPVFKELRERVDGWSSDNKGEETPRSVQVDRFTVEMNLQSVSWFELYRFYYETQVMRTQGPSEEGPKE